MQADLELHGLVVIGEAHGQLPHTRCPGERPRHKAGQSGALLKPANHMVPSYEPCQSFGNPSCQLSCTPGGLNSIACSKAGRLSDVTHGPSEMVDNSMLGIQS